MDWYFLSKDFLFRFKTHSSFDPSTLLLSVCVFFLFVCFLIVIN